MFEDIGMGPFMAIDDLSPSSMEGHYDTLLSQFLIPVALVKDPNNEVVKVFGGDSSFNTKGVFVNIYYITEFRA